MFVRELLAEEGNRLKRLSRKASSEAKRERALIVWASATRMSSRQIAALVGTDESHVRKVIHAFNERGFDSLDPEQRGGRSGLAPEEVTGPGGLLTQLAGRVVEAALGAELSEHLGCPPGQAPPGGAPNVRNGSTVKTLGTDLGPVQVRTPRDRDGSFEPQLVAKRQRRLAGLDQSENPRATEAPRLQASVKWRELGVAQTRPWSLRLP